ncbi:hypothetical protein BGZ76_005646 [Entomortierella beljakovae]|nr:hypothetical protein BGZ76_005646 [Entomortierella beljakovae]
MSSTNTSVTVFGLGAMGLVLAQKFQDSGFKVTVWNRTPEKAKGLVEKGAHLASSIAEGFEASNLIVICLLDNNSVNHVIQQALPSLRGRTIVNLTNGTPNHARETGAVVVAQEAQYIHGGIMATPNLVGTPAATIFYSGSTEGFQSVQKDLAVLGTTKYFGTDFGTASLYDIALLSGMYGLFTGFTHSVSLVRSQEGKQSITEFTSLLIPWLTEMTNYLNFLAKQIDDNDYATKGSSIAMQIPAIENIAQASQDAGVIPDLIRPIEGLFKKAAAAGHGNDDLSVLVNFTAQRED